MRLISTAILPLLSAGCVFGPVNYKPPENSPTTIIKFVNKSDGKLRISIYEESHNCQRRRKIENLEAGHETSHIIYTDKRLTFQYYQTLPLGRRYCLLNIRFNPRSDKEYIFYSNTNASSCFWSMTDIIMVKTRHRFRWKKFPGTPRGVRTALFAMAKTSSKERRVTNGCRLD